MFVLSQQSSIKVIRKAFTLIEILMVVFILSIAATLAMPLLSSAADIQLRSAANMAASDLEYAKSLAISTQKTYSVVFDSSADAYQLEDQNGNVITHPSRGGLFAVDLNNDSRLDNVHIASADFDSTQKVTFDYLGSPYNGSGTALNSGSVVLSADSMSMTVSVEPVTGYVSIN